MLFLHIFVSACAGLGFYVITGKTHKVICDLLYRRRCAQVYKEFVKANEDYYKDGMIWYVSSQPPPQVPFDDAYYMDSWYGRK